jgi:hypothetical protein
MALVSNRRRAVKPVRATRWPSQGMIVIAIPVLPSRPPCLLDIQPGLASGTGLGLAHPGLPTIMAFRTFHLLHINTVVIRVLITFECISLCILLGRRKAYN